MSSRKIPSKFSSRLLKRRRIKSLQRKDTNSYDQWEYRQYIRKLPFDEIIKEMKKWMDNPRQFRFYQKGDPEFFPLTPEERKEEEKENMQDNYNSPLWEFQNTFLEDRQPHPTTALWAVIMHLGDVFRGTVGNRLLQYYPFDKMREAKRDIYYIRPEALKEGISRFPAVDKKVEELIESSSGNKKIYWMDRRSEWNSGYESQMKTLNELISKGLINDNELEDGNSLFRKRINEYIEKLDLLIEYTEKFPVDKLEQKKRKLIELNSLETIKKLSNWILNLNPKDEMESFETHISETREIVEDFHRENSPLLKKMLEET